MLYRGVGLWSTQIHAVTKQANNRRGRPTTQAPLHADLGKARTYNHKSSPTEEKSFSPRIEEQEIFTPFCQFMQVVILQE